MKTSKYYIIHFDTDEKYLNFDSTVIKLSKKKVIINDDCNKRYNVVETIVNKINEKLIHNKISDLKNVKTLYRYPGISLSRDRVGLFCDKTGLKIIRDKNLADARVISKRIIEKTMNVTYNETEFITFDKYIDLVNHRDAGVYAFKNLDILNSYVTQLKHWMIENNISGDDLLTCASHHYYNSKWDKTVDKLVDSMRAYDRQKNSSYVKNYSVKVVDNQLFDEFFNGSFKWLMDDECNRIMSDISVSINDEMFINIKDMLKGGSTDDLGVAMTMMANAKIEGSETYLGMIFFHFGERMKGTKVWNQVGFKSLRQRFQKYYDSTSYNHGHAGRYDQMIKLLIEDDALTIQAMEHILDLVFHTVVKEATGLSSSKVFRLERSSISLTSEYKLKANEQGLSQALKGYSHKLPF